MSLRTFFTRNIIATDPHNTPTSLDIRERPSLASIDWGHMPEIDGPKPPGPWDNIRTRD